MANTAANVSTGKPKIGGAVHVADPSVTLPTDATTALSNDFNSLGYVSEDGVTNSMTIDTESIKAWGGDIVDTLENSKDDTFKLTLIESLNVNVLKEVHVADNVSGTTLEDGITVTVNTREHVARAWVIDMIMKGNILKRVVIPAGKITEVGDVVYKDDEVVGYEVTIKANPDSAGNYHYEYLKKAA